MRRGVLIAGLILAGLSAFAEDIQLISDPSFEQPPAAICDVRKPVCLKASSSLLFLGSPQFSPHSGLYYVTLGGHGRRQTDFLIQQVTIPSQATAAILRFYLRVVTKERSSNATDKLIVEVRTVEDALLETLEIYSNQDASADYVEQLFDLSAYAGQTIQIAFTSVEDSSQPTWFLLDDMTLTASR